MADDVYDVLIIGGGMAGLGAGLYAGRLHMHAAIISEIIGGAILMTKDIENYPGFKDISGIELTDRIHEQVKAHGIKIIENNASKIEKSKDGFKVYAGENSYSSRTVIIVTGTEWRKLNVSGEKEFTGRGVHYCALCDAPFYKDKVIGIVGGSDSALKEAMMLSTYGTKVYVINRTEKLRAEPRNIKKIHENKKIELILNTRIVEIKGNKFIEHVVFDKPYKGKNDFKLDGLFIDIGRIPVCDLAKSISAALNEKDEIITNDNCETNIPGLFAAGDVTNSQFKQAVIAVADGVKAANSAYRYVKDN